MTQSLSPDELLRQSDVIFDARQVEAAVQDLAERIAGALADARPLVLSVMSGGAVFAGQLLTRLQFPLEFGYVQANRYHNQTRGDEIVWKVAPDEKVRGRTVLLVDDILDEGMTLAEVRDKCLEAGAARVFIAVLTDKDHGREKPIEADFVGLVVPDRYVFGYGMDVYGWWRNLASIRALK